MVRMRGEFVEFDPRTWANQYDVSINVGLGAGNRQEQMAMLSMVLAKQEQLIAQYGPVYPVAPGATNRCGWECLSTTKCAGGADIQSCLCCALACLRAQSAGCHCVTVALHSTKGCKVSLAAQSHKVCVADAPRIGDAVLHHCVSYATNKELAICARRAKPHGYAQPSACDKKGIGGCVAITVLDLM